MLTEHHTQDIPTKNLLKPGKIGQVLCLGNLTSPSVYAWLRTLAPDLHIVKGDYDCLPPPPAAQPQVGNPG
ncbi:hypothetical protein LTR28_005334, partial [Elasticomyces elasticus]